MKGVFENEVVERLMSTQSPNIVIGVEHLIYCCLSMFVKIADVKRTRFNVVLSDVGIKWERLNLIMSTQSPNYCDQRAEHLVYGNGNGLTVTSC